MAYQQNGLIEATDYNNFVANVNTIWSTGSGDRGYGQVALGTVTAGANVVTATQWATLLNTINSIRQHQTAGAPFASIPTTGDIIAVVSAVGDNIINSNTAANVFTGTLGTATTVGTINDTITLASGTTNYNVTTTIQVEFDSTEERRYFFNAGGGVVLDITTGTTTNNARCIAVRDMLNSVDAFRINARTSSASGALGFAGTWGTNKGFHDLTSVATTLYSSTFGGVYSTSSSFTITARLNGNNIEFQISLAISAGATYVDTADNGSIQFSVAVNSQPPATTFLTTNSWGTVSASGS